MKFTVSLYDLAAGGGALLALAASAFLHPALPAVAVGVLLTAWGAWNHKHGPPDRPDRPARG